MPCASAARPSTSLPPLAEVGVDEQQVEPDDDERDQRRDVDPEAVLEHRARSRKSGRTDAGDGGGGGRRGSASAEADVAGGRDRDRGQHAAVEHEQRDGERKDREQAHGHLDRVHGDRAALAEQDALEELRSQRDRDAGDRDQQLAQLEPLRHARRDELDEDARDDPERAETSASQMRVRRDAGAGRGVAGSVVRVGGDHPERPELNDQQREAERHRHCTAAFHPERPGDDHGPTTLRTMAAALAPSMSSTSVRRRRGSVAAGVVVTPPDGGRRRRYRRRS